MERSEVVLTLRIDNSKPIALSSFVRAFTSLAAEYKQAAKSDANFADTDADIFIKEIRSGSIVADLIPVAASLIPLVAAEIDKVTMVVDFVKKWEERLSFLAKGIIPLGASKSDLRRWMDGVESIARDPDATSTLEAAIFQDGRREIKASLSFNSREASKITEVIESELLRIEEKSDASHNRVLMVFTRPDIGKAPIGKRSGERVLISEISNNPLAITYG